MNAINIFLLEAAQKPVPVKFIIHRHNPRRGSEHYDLRFMDRDDNTLLHSFAFGSDFLEKLSDRIVGVKTKDHDPRWLTLKSHRLEDIDKGIVIITIGSSKYFDLTFKGKVIKGQYKLFKLKTKRKDNWLLTNQSTNKKTTQNPTRSNLL